MIPVHDDAVALRQESHVPGLFGTLGNFGQRYLLEYRLQMRQHIGVICLHHWSQLAPHQFLGARAGRDQSYSDLHQSNVTFGGGHHARTAHYDLGPASQRHPEGGHHDRLWAGPHALEEGLKRAPGLVNQVHVALLGGHGHGE